jgi:hypothetical protein
VHAVHSSTGDFRDHDAIRAWALEVAADLDGTPSSAAPGERQQ